MTKRWHSKNCRSTQSALDIYRLHEGALNPWDAAPTVLTPDHVNFPNPLFLAGYQRKLRYAISKSQWCDTLVNGKIPCGQQLHRTKIVRLPRCFGDKVIPVDGTPKYLPAQLAGHVKRYWIIPFFDTIGSASESLSKELVIAQGNPPRIIISKVDETETYVADFVVQNGTHYHYGKYTSIDRAMKSSMQLFEAVLLTPEDLPDFVRNELSKDYYGIVRYECLPIHKQVSIQDYDLAIQILASAMCIRFEHLPESFLKKFWETPEEVMQRVENNREALICCHYYGKDIYDGEIVHGHRLMPLLNGRYTKTLFLLFRKAKHLQYKADAYSLHQISNSMQQYLSEL